MLQDALLKMEVSFGEKHGGTLSCRGALVKSMISQRRFAEAVSLLKRLLVLAEGTLSPGHMIICQASFDLGMAYAGQGRLDEALGMSRRATEGIARERSDEQLSTMAWMSNVTHLEELVARGSQSLSAENLA
ncbi:uncharacterized protein RSE6_12961 [Rhynchosporium secalis]|uniref:MalT-like TPR region domain-containing protein n=1 Tax=Rhynchosporium secalis TaxID=38038 RepID=A0A1E1MRQ1_RHYSE|nr:uncharacterized protein RSE6_12961 [Rhynchosporium secalis]